MSDVCAKETQSTCVNFNSNQDIHERAGRERANVECLDGCLRRTTCKIPLLIGMPIAVPDLHDCVQARLVSRGSPIHINALHLIRPRQINRLLSGVVPPFLVLLPVAIPDLQPIAVFVISTWKIDAFGGISLVTNLPSVCIEYP